MNSRRGPIVNFIVGTSERISICKLRPRRKISEPLNPCCMPQELQAQLAQVRASKGQVATNQADPNEYWGHENFDIARLQISKH